MTSHFLVPGRRAFFAGAFLTAVLGAAAWAEEARPVPGPASVRIDNFTFSPAILTIPVGTTVIWENVDDIPHTVVSIAARMRSKPLDTNDSFSFTFKDAGEFTYFCSLHPHMTGKIVVK